MTKDNNILGKFELTGIPAAPRGVPQIEVSFELNADGILKVSAGDKGTGKSESITINNDKGRLSQEEIDRMVAEAEQYAEEDKATTERITARNGLENYSFSLKNQVNDQEGLGGKIDDDDKETVSLTTSLAPWMPQLTDPSSSKPSRKPPNGLKKMLPPLQRPISRNKKKSSAASPFRLPASSTPAATRHHQAPTTVIILLTTSYKAVVYADRAIDEVL